MILSDKNELHTDTRLAHMLTLLARPNAATRRMMSAAVQRPHTGRPRFEQRD